MDTGLQSINIFTGAFERVKTKPLNLLIAHVFGKDA